MAVSACGRVCAWQGPRCRSTAVGVVAIGTAVLLALQASRAPLARLMLPTMQNGARAVRALSTRTGPASITTSRQRNAWDSKHAALFYLQMESNRFRSNFRRASSAIKKATNHRRARLRKASRAIKILIIRSYSPLSLRFVSGSSCRCQLSADSWHEKIFGDGTPLGGRSPREAARGARTNAQSENR